MRERLRPGAPFALVDLCVDKNGRDWDRRVDRFRRFALDSGADLDDVEATVLRVRAVLHTVISATTRDSASSSTASRT